MLSEKIEQVILDNGLAEQLGINASNIVNDYETEKVCKEWEKYLLKIYNINKR